MIKIYNSLVQEKQEFIPIESNKLRLYVCGVTVYDYCHIGHARTYTAFDVIIRYFKYCNYDVTYVRNITDIDDKIIKRAIENGESPDALVARFTKIMHEEFTRLGLLEPNVEPKATETIPEMIAMIAQLIKDHHAYHVPGGDVYYDVASFKDYGKLSHQNLEGLQSGIRVDVSEQKKNPLDFVLWKAAKPGEPSWDSPWGPGRPGWHIECSAMSRKILGTTFDIHGGGSDLKFPHHENEIAQSEAANHCDFAHYWMHSGMVQINQEKMSKSLGNFFVIKDVLDEYPADVVRYFLISGHYRSELNYSDENLKTAKAALRRFYRALRDVVPDENAAPDAAQAFIESFQRAMDDDFNTPEALAVLFNLARQLNQCKSSDEAVDKKLAQGLAATLIKLGSVLGILQKPESEVFPQNAELEAEVERLIQLRTEAKANKDYAKADQYRDEIAAKGVLLMDTPHGVDWEWV
jgi:cysteinyl-tRNA synthetase